MVIHNSYPNKYASIIVQINFIDFKTTGFFSARNEQDVLDYLNNNYSTNVIAIFKCKLKLKP
jgi:uncharacterized beta-barrel protein YwiB (DUF1934 family)